MLIVLFLVVGTLSGGCSSAAVISSGQQRRPQSVVHGHHHHHQARTRCPWPIQMDAGQNGQQADVAGTRAYLAPVVFEGKARSKSDGPVYRVTFDVVTVYKGEVTAGSQVRLEFKSNQTASGAGPAAGARRTSGGIVKNHHHHHHHNHQSSAECLVTADIRTGRRYLVFAAHWSANNLTAVGSPLIHTKKSVKDVRSTLCPRCGELLTIFLSFFFSFSS